jgi:hypothetical protein
MTAAATRIPRAESTRNPRPIAGRIGVDVRSFVVRILSVVVNEALHGLKHEKTYENRAGRYGDVHVKCSGTVDRVGEEVKESGRQHDPAGESHEGVDVSRPAQGCCPAGKCREKGDPSRQYCPTH